MALAALVLSIVLSNAGGTPCGPVTRNFMRTSCLPAVRPGGAVDVPYIFGEDNLPHSVAVQRRLTDFFHRPCDCAKASMWRLCNQGYGSDMHTLYWGVAEALRLGVHFGVVVARWRYSNRQSSNTDEFYANISSCSSCTRMERKWTCFCKRGCAGKKKPVSDERRLYQAVPPPREVPEILREFGLTISAMRAHIIRYIMRSLNDGFADDVAKQMRVFAPPNGTLPACISVHVRRSDKVCDTQRSGCEMRRVPFSDYMAAAVEIRKNEPRLQTIFLTSEDDSVISEARGYDRAGTKKEEAFDFVIPEEERHNLPHWIFVRQFGAYNVMVRQTAYLALHTQCGGFVCTMRSNWCRLIEELRKTSDRYSAQAIDLSPRFVYQHVQFGGE